MRAERATESFSVPGGLLAPRTARERVRPLVIDLLSDEELYDFELLVAEVVTNAVRHGGAGDGTTIEVRLTVDGELHLEVLDQGPGFDRPAKPTARATGGGNGFVLLELLARDWGVRRGSGTAVWFAFAPGGA
jgi:anti-sigma regulatory factor (Ser/Thr protein kinase)